MSTKKLIWVGMFVGSTVAGFIPTLWGAGLLSMSGFLCSSAGAFIGIWLGYKAGTFL